MGIFWFSQRIGLMVTKSTSVYREMTKRPIFKITGNFSFNIPVQPPILRSSKGLLLFLKVIYEGLCSVRS